MLSAIWGVLLSLSPWLLLGMIVAGAIHVLLPPTFIKRQLSGRAGVLKAVALGVPLPLCSCGVIPAGLGLKEDGASSGASVGFLISTPQTGVDSILVSASFLGWPFALAKVVAAAVTGVVGGWLTDAVTPKAADRPSLENEARPARLGVRDGVAHGLSILRTIWGWIVFGVLVSAAIEFFVPAQAFAAWGAQGGLLAFGAALLLSLPLYVCATASVPIAAALVHAGMPVGAAMVFLMAGPATNVATLGAIYRGFGSRVVGVYLGTIIAGSVGFGLALDLLWRRETLMVPHVHEHAAWWAVASAVVLMALCAFYAAADARAWLGRRRVKQKGSRQVKLAVQGMTCGGCVSKLESELRDLDGVEAVAVTLEPGSAVVVGAIEEHELRAAIEAAGFGTT